MTPSRSGQRARPVTRIAYPLYATPRPWLWKTSANEMDGLCALAKLKANVVTLDWGGRRTLFAALSCGTDSHYALFRFVRLKKDSIDRIDIDKLKEDLIRPGPSEWLGESVHFVLDTANWIAIGEHDPRVVAVPGSWPERLFNQAFSSAGRQERIAFHPFPSKAFRDVVLGRAIEKYFLKLGPVSVQTLEEEGFKSDAIAKIIAEDQVTALDVTISVKATTGTDEKKASLLERIAAGLKGHSAKVFRIRTEEGTLFDLLRENFVKYTFETVDDPQALSEELHRTTLDRMRGLLANHEADLRGAIPPTRAIESFFEPDRQGDA